MPEELKIRFDSDVLQFLRRKKASGQSRSAQEYVRTLVRNEMLREQNQASLWLRNHLRAGLTLPQDEFLPIDAASILAEARRRGAKDAD